MPRVARIVATGLAHHITHRGNRKLEVFLDDDDRGVYLRLLRISGTKYGLDVLAYCLMSNHVHLVAVPREADSLARAIAYAHTSYTRHFNRKYSLSGHLWQGRFFSCVLDERHALAAARYVERNPVRAGIVGRAWDYKWSSARSHIGETDDPILAKTWPPKELLSQWQQLLRDDEGAGEVDEFRRSTSVGSPVGSASFIRKIERALGRSLKRRRRGRPFNPD